MSTHDEKTFIPYGKQSIDQEDIDAVVRVLKSGWLTTGPEVASFEGALKKVAQTKHAMALSNGTAALHAVAHALQLGPGDEVIVPTITFTATANAAVYVGATPVFADVRSDDMLLDPEEVRKKITKNTKAIFAVDFAGQACDYHSLRGIADEYGLALVSDSCHAIGATYQGKPIADWADMAIFSFHPVKHICAGEGGAVVTNNDLWAKQIRRFRNHGIDKDVRQRQEQGTWYYEQVDLGYNYRLSDIHCALGRSQLAKLPKWIEERQRVAKAYAGYFAEQTGVRPLVAHKDRSHTYHLMIAVFDDQQSRDSAYELMRAHQIGVNVHYTPVHLQPFYQNNYGTGPGDCPVAEKLYDRILTLPMYPGLTQEDLERVFDLVSNVVVQPNNISKAG
tara:strand:+ start:625 stop:1800 length:1176 start_codon:yes stop_codon:yes gene_type:complete